MTLPPRRHIPFLSAAPAHVLNRLAPRRGIVSTWGIPFAPEAGLALDIHAPAIQAAGAGGRGAPVVVFLYGGGWQSGDRSLYHFVGAALAARGFVTVIPDYRVWPEVRFPAFLQDAAAAVAWTRANIAKFGGDPGRTFLLGHSAGAHIAAMLALDRQWLRAAGLDTGAIAGMAGLAGPYDFLPFNDPVHTEIFGPAGDLRLTQPVTFARGGAPPLFLASGGADRVVLPRNSISLAERMSASGGQADARIYPGIGHLQILGAFAGLLRWRAPVLDDVTGFFAGV